ncbi:MAG: hypothetical protein GF421_06470 [Candidatus Aminicenantes bacterium]|nr:hypothetical protein [Candidatus Aminicenantes bacterium]
MTDHKLEQEQYYQTIARCLFDLRGSPLILSSQEIQVIEEWEKQCIPLNAVLEGVQSAHEHFKRSRQKRGTFNLSFCSGFVSTAFSQQKERKIGQKSEDQSLDEKIHEIRIQINNFLENIPGEVRFLKSIYEEILDDLSKGELNEDLLEQRDEQVDQKLLYRVSEGLIKQFAKKAGSEYRVTRESEKIQIAQRKYIKNTREKHKIPYVSLYYY